MEKVNLKNNKGITLVALVVTIIILIILAGVTITILLGENGLIQRTKIAADDTVRSKEKEVINLAYSEVLMDRMLTTSNVKLTAENLKGKIESYNGQDTVIVTETSDGEFSILYKDTNNTYNLTDGKITDNNNNNDNNHSGIKSVKDFGAIGDGVTDDTVAFNLAMQSNEDKIWIPSGTYLVSGQVEVKNSKEIFGDGQSSVVKLKGDTPSNKKYGVNDAEIHIFDILDMENVTLKNFKLDANKDEYTNYEQQYRAETNFTVPLYILRSSNITLEDMYVCDGIIEGIYVGISNNITVKNVTTYGNGYIQDDASGLHFDSCYDVEVENLNSYENGFDGLLLTATSYAKVNNCKLNKNGHAGLYMQYESNNNYINDVECKQNQWGVFIKAGCAHNVLNDFKINNNNETEMVITSSYDNLLNNSTITNASHNGIDFRKNIDRDASYTQVSNLKGWNVSINAVTGGEIYKEAECSEASAEFINNLPDLTNIWIDEANGTETVSTNSKATACIPAILGFKMKISNNENKKMLVFSYDSNKQFLWEEDVYTGSGEYTIANEETKYLRIVIMDNPSENIEFNFNLCK